MKRFTETEKWRDPWFQKLSNEHRTLWLWLCDRVDNSGVIDICWPICCAETSGKYDENSMLAFGDKVERLETGKWWIPKFVNFQVGELSEKCKPHVYIINLLKKNNLYHRVCHKVCNTFKEKEQEKEKDKEQETEMPLGAIKALTPKPSGNRRRMVGPLEFEFRSTWNKEYIIKFGEPYVPKGEADDKSLDKLLSHVPDVGKLTMIAKKAWELPDDFNCKMAVTISGFYSRFNEIRARVLNQKNHVITNKIRPSYEDINHGK